MLAGCAAIPRQVTKANGLRALLGLPAVITLSKYPSQELTEAIENYRFSDMPDAAKSGASGTTPCHPPFP